MINIKRYSSSNIAINKKAYYNFLIEETIESGLILQGWEVKSLRNSKVNIKNGYIIFNGNEVFLIGIYIQPIIQNTNYIINNKSNRNIKLLLHRKEIYYLYGKYKQLRYSLIALALYWKKSWCKLKIGIAKGKTNLDKRENKKKKEWMIQKQKIVRYF
ncbi:SsrA-binding protein SmpB [Buchnera aphidicola]|uniref:SsrA-binding protein n=1 Tax=Buchnera aphidicola (Stegophylla sp.) TaxID=2315800 RepID=A0A4D6YEB6_9GAMM|nr:SsrA-binding protein SmpB [Buchnera aphidicola (Stegophylla sp.)]QCI26343.1 SsrA-binding protein SmpB [Buchnera aphidicola (Stegophylla sp.)]